METSLNTTKSPSTIPTNSETKCLRCQSKQDIVGEFCHHCTQIATEAYKTIPPFYRKKKYVGVLPEWPSPRVFLTLTGETGKGKSICAASLVYDLYKAQREIVTWKNCAELFAEIRDTFRDSARSSELDYINQMGRAKLLVLDDLAAEKVSDYSISTLYIILNKRGEFGRPTIITSNLTLKQIADTMGKRIADRLYRYGPVVTMT